MRHRNFRNMFGVGRGQLRRFGMLGLGMMNQYGRPVISGGRGRMGGDKPGSGPGGDCVCPSCSATVPHATGVPCNQVSCPKCGTTMTKE